MMCAIMSCAYISQETYSFSWTIELYLAIWVTDLVRMHSHILVTLKNITFQNSLPAIGRQVCIKFSYNNFPHKKLLDKSPRNRRTMIYQNVVLTVFRAG